MSDEIKNNSGSPAMEKSFASALRVIRLYQHLSDKKKEFVLSRQVLRSGTRIGEMPGHLRIFRQKIPLSIKKRGKHLTGCVFFMRQNT